MAKFELLITLAFALLACCTEINDIELKKRDTGKSTNLNTIPSGVQKQEYSYIYQNSHPQSSSQSNSYQNQAPNSFYPTQSSSHYYTSNPTSESNTAYTPQSPSNQIGTQSTSQFVPLNFLPNPGYQTKYHLVHPKTTGNLQLAILPQPNSLPQQQIPYAQVAQLFAMNPAGQIHQNAFGSLPQFNFVPNPQPISFNGPYLGQPPSMVLLAQPNPAAIGNLPYSNQVQSLYNYFPSHSQPKYGVTYSSAAQQGYDKLPGTINTSFSKEGNEIGSQSTDYTPQSDLNSSYKNTYTSQTSYSKPL